MRKPIISANEFAERVNKVSNGRISIVKEHILELDIKLQHIVMFTRFILMLKQQKIYITNRTNCPECSKEIQDKNTRLKYVPFSQMLERFRKLYGDKFSYDDSTYCGLKKKMKVHCNDCGEDFEITPEHHLKYNNGGCPKCHLTRIVRCMKCGKEIVVDRHVSLNIKILCDECKDDIIKSNIINKETVKNRNTTNKEIRNHKTKNNKNCLKRCPFCGQLYNTNEQCENELCNKFQSIKDLKKLIPFGFDYSTIGTIRYIDEFNKAIDLLLYEYFNNKLSPRQIYEKYNC